MGAGKNTDQKSIVTLPDIDYGKVERLASLNLSPGMIAKKMDYPPAVFRRAYSDSTTELHRRIEKGYITGEILANENLKDLIEVGNTTAIQQFQKNKEKAEIETLKEKFFG